MTKVPLVLLVVLFALPAVRTAVAVHFQWHTAISYPLFQLVMIAAPIIVWLSYRQPRRAVMARIGVKRTNLRGGLVLGLLMAGIILAGYYGLFRSMVDPAAMLAKIKSLGLLRWYWLMAVVMSLWNALFEEYFWRAFLVSELAVRLRSTAAICILGGAMFGAHHVFALMDVFSLPMTALFAFGTMLAGGAWTYMRCRGYSIWDCYVSHILADLAVFTVGYDLLAAA